MPAHKLKEARVKCLQQHESFSVRGSCMTSAERKYKEANDPTLAVQAQARKLAQKQGRVRELAVSGYREVPPGYSSESDIAKFEIDPAAVPEVRREVADRIPPEPLQIGQRAFYLGIQSADFPTMDAFQEYMNQSTEYFVLTPAEPMMEDRAFMTLYYPSFHESRGAETAL